jgi:hypothetical protein
VLVFTIGRSPEHVLNKSLALQNHLFGTEVANLVLVIMSNAVHMLGSAKLYGQLKGFLGEESQVGATEMRRVTGVTA